MCENNEIPNDSKLAEFEIDNFLPSRHEVQRFLDAKDYLDENGILVDAPLNAEGWFRLACTYMIKNHIRPLLAKKKLRRMTYKELDKWLEQGKGVVRMANVVKNTISYDCEDRNREISDYYKICGYDEDTWHYPMIES